MRTETDVDVAIDVNSKGRFPMIISSGRVDGFPQHANSCLDRSHPFSIVVVIRHHIGILMRSLIGNVCNVVLVVNPCWILHGTHWQAVPIVDKIINILILNLSIPTTADAINSLIFWIQIFSDNVVFVVVVFCSFKISTLTTSDITNGWNSWS